MTSVALECTPLRRRHAGENAGHGGHGPRASRHQRLATASRARPWTRPTAAIAGLRDRTDSTRFAFMVPCPRPSGAAAVGHRRSVTERARALVLHSGISLGGGVAGTSPPRCSDASPVRPAARCRGGGRGSPTRQEPLARMVGRDRGLPPLAGMGQRGRRGIPRHSGVIAGLSGRTRAG